MAAPLKPTLLIIDVHALAHRAFHAFPIDWKTKRGEHTNAIYGFATMLLQVLKQFQPDYVIAAKDSPGPTYRHELYDKYKATRPKMDEVLKEQLPRISELISTLKIPVIAQEGYEADDVIGSICKSKAYADFSKIVVTGDRDLFQVLNGDVKVYLAGSSFSKSTLYDEDAAAAKMGFASRLTVDYKALRGDNSDNIPGVPGVGEKTALELITRYESLENIYEHLEELKPAVRTKLENGREMAFLSRKLAQIEFQVPVVLDLDNSELRDLDFTELRKLFEYYEFRSLLGKLNGFTKGAGLVDEVNTAKPVQMEFNSESISTEAEARKMVELLMQQDSFVLFGDHPQSMFTKPARVYYAMNNKVYGVGLNDLTPGMLKVLEPLYSSGKAVVYDGKKEQHAALNLGLTELKYQDDLMLIDYLLQAGVGKVDFAASVERWLSIKLEQEQQQSLFAEEQGYAQTYQILLLRDILRNRFSEKTTGQKWDLKRLYRGVELPLTRVLTLVERNGIKLDKEQLNKFAEELDGLIADVQKEIYKEAGEDFNISSPKQLGHILYEKLKMPTGKKTKGGSYSTNEKVLMNNIAQFPIIEKILTYRELFKLKSTYTNALIDQINSETGRVHTSFNQAVVATGRLSSTDPNLQNIPTSTDLGQRIRSAFVAAPGKQLVSFDYSQQELRLLAHFSNEEKLIQYFVDGHDIHAATAAQIFKVPLAEVNKSQRRVGKTVNFGVVYGISAFGLADRLKIPTNQAQAFIDAFYESYPKVKVYFESIKAEARNNGYIESLFGRRRDASGLNAPNFQARAAAEREIINFPLQGSAADIMKLAMIKAQEVIEEKYPDFARMVLQVHDELIFEISEAEPQLEQAFLEDIKSLMSDIVKLNVPVQVSGQVAQNWGNLK